MEPTVPPPESAEPEPYTHELEKFPIKSSQNGGTKRTNQPTQHSSSQLGGLKQVISSLQEALDIIKEKVMSTEEAMVKECQQRKRMYEQQQMELKYLKDEIRVLKLSIEQLSKKRGNLQAEDKVMDEEVSEPKEEVNDSTTPTNVQTTSREKPITKNEIKSEEEKKEDERQAKIKENFWAKAKDLLQHEKYSECIDEVINVCKEITDNRIPILEIAIVCLNNLYNHESHLQCLQKTVKGAISVLYPGEILPLLTYVSRLNFTAQTATLFMDLLFKATDPVVNGSAYGSYKVMQKKDYLRFTDILLQKLILPINQQVLQTIGFDQISVLVERAVWTHSKNYFVSLDSELTKESEPELLKKSILLHLQTISPTVSKYLMLVLGCIETIMSFKFQFGQLSEYKKFIFQLEKVRTHYFASNRQEEWKEFLQVILSRHSRKKALKKMIEDWENTQPQIASNDWYKKTNILLQKLMASDPTQPKKRKKPDAPLIESPNKHPALYNPLQTSMSHGHASHHMPQHNPIIPPISSLPNSMTANSNFHNPTPQPTQAFDIPQQTPCQTCRQPIFYTASVPCKKCNNKIPIRLHPLGSKPPSVGFVTLDCPHCRMSNLTPKQTFVIRCKNCNSAPVYMSN